MTTRAERSRCGGNPLSVHTHRVDKNAYSARPSREDLPGVTPVFPQNSHGGVMVMACRPPQLPGSATRQPGARGVGTKGLPLSVRMRRGNPYSRNRQVHPGVVSATAWQPKSYRLKPLTTVRGTLQALPEDPLRARPRASRRNAGRSPSPSGEVGDRRYRRFSQRLASATGLAFQ